MAFKIGFVGTTAAHAFMFLDTLRLLPDTVEEIVLVETDAARIETAGADKVYGDVAGMLDAEEPDLCFIMRRTDEVEPPAVRCAEAGVPLVIDKPVAATAETVRRILAACERGGVNMATCYTWRYSAAARDIRRWVQGGVIGKPYCLDMRMVTTAATVRRQDPQFAWLFEREHSGGGIFIWLGCHFIDLMRFLLGTDVRAVTATTARLTAAPSDVEDVASVSFELEDGEVATLHAAYVMPDGFRSPYDTGLTVWGDGGDITWRPLFPPHPTVRVRSQHPDWSASPERTISYHDRVVPGAYCEEQFVLDYFRDMIRGLVAGEEPVAMGEDALRVVEICQAAYHSAATGQRVEL